MRPFIPWLAAIAACAACARAAAPPQDHGTAGGSACAPLLRVAGEASCHGGGSRGLAERGAEGPLLDARLDAATRLADGLGDARWSCLERLATTATRDRGVTSILLARGFAAEPARAAAWRASPDPGLRVAAVGALAFAPRAEALSGVVAALADPAAPVRIEALGVLARLGASPPVVARAVEPLLDDAEPQVRGAAAAALGAVGATSTGGRLLQLLGEGDEEVLVRVIYAVKALRVPGAGPRLRTLALASPSPRVRQAAADALARSSAIGARP